MHTDKKPGACDGHRARNEITALQGSRLGAGSAISFVGNRLRLNAVTDDALARIDRCQKSSRTRWNIEKDERVVELRIQRQARLALLNPSVESLPILYARLTAQGRRANG
jgi:hypothetical protein